MPDELLSDRVERLEKTVEGLQTLPAEVAALGERVGSVETQILQLRAEVHVEFSDVRGEMRTGFANVKAELRQEIAGLRGEMYDGFAAARDDMLVGLANVTREIQETAEEGKRHSRMLFEEALGRIATLGEHREESPRRRPGAPRRKR
jgi:hypothetical protein